MTQVKKYLGNLLIPIIMNWSCSVTKSINKDLNEKTFRSFDLSKSELVLSNDARFTLTVNSLKTSGILKKKDNEYHFLDTIFNADNVILSISPSKDSVINDGFVKIQLMKDMRLIAIMHSYKNGNPLDLQLVNGSLIRNKSDLDSFYISFLGIDGKSIIYNLSLFKDYNTILLNVPDQVFYSLSLGEEIGYLTMKGNKIGLSYFLNGMKQRKYFYLSPKAVNEDYKIKIKFFNKNGYLLD